MSIEFELQRKQEKIEKLMKEAEQLNLQLPILRRDEQVELTRTRRDYNLKISQTEARILGIKKELEAERRQLDRLRAQMEKEKEEAEEEALEKVNRRFRRF